LRTAISLSYTRKREDKSGGVRTVWFRPPPENYVVLSGRESRAVALLESPQGRQTKGDIQGLENKPGRKTKAERIACGQQLETKAERHARVR